jgi:hypothetical protein
MDAQRERDARELELFAKAIRQGRSDADPAVRSFLRNARARSFAGALCSARTRRRIASSPPAGLLAFASDAAVFSRSEKFFAKRNHQCLVNHLMHLVGVASVTSAERTLAFNVGGTAPLHHGNPVTDR